jgi:aspartyl-tRNA(Asn)/glutamyl-tRNA(Gln) amidotransferase subunit C
MKLTREEVHRVAILARLHFTPEEEEQLTGELDDILAYMDKLNQLDTSAVAPFTHGEQACHDLREDLVTNQPDADALLANAPERDDTFFKVPKIIE